MGNGFPKSCRLLKSREFQALFKNSQYYQGKVLAISWRRTSLAAPRLGITVSKKQGDSVKRNRFKRLVREAFRTLCPKDIGGIDLNIRPRGRCGFPPSFAEVVEDFSTFFKTVTV